MPLPAASLAATTSRVSSTARSRFSVSSTPVRIAVTQRSYASGASAGTGTACQPSPLASLTSSSRVASEKVRLPSVPKTSMVNGLELTKPASITPMAPSSYPTVTTA